MKIIHLNNPVEVTAYVSLDDIDQDELKEYIRTAYEPDDVFGDDQLEAWAEENGFVKQDEEG